MGGASNRLGIGMASRPPNARGWKDPGFVLGFLGAFIMMLTMTEAKSSGSMTALAKSTGSSVPAWTPGAAFENEFRDSWARNRTKQPCLARIQEVKIQIPLKCFRENELFYENQTLHKLDLCCVTY